MGEEIIIGKIFMVLVPEKDVQTYYEKVRSVKNKISKIQSFLILHKVHFEMIFLILKKFACDFMKGQGFYKFHICKYP